MFIRVKLSWKKTWKYIKAHKPYWLHGVIFFLLLFAISGLMNSSLSYMGNESADIAAVIIKQFWPIILYQLFKIFIIYMLLGALFNIFYLRSIITFERISGLKLHKRLKPLIIYSMMILSFIMLFFKSIIMNPQLFIENFAQKTEAFQSFQFFLTNNVNPGLFSILFFIINIPFLLLFISSFDYGHIKSRVVSLIIYIKSKRILTGLSIVLLLILLYSLIPFTGFSSEKNISKKNILIISSDAVRPDRFGANGHFRKVTPNIDKLIKEGVQYRKVITAVPRTFPSWVSCLTSSYPVTHGVKHMFPRTRERSEKFPTAIDVLKEKGYYTSVVSDFAGDIFPRVDLGFENVKAPELNFNVLIKQIILEKQTFLLPFLLNKGGRRIFPEIRGIVKFSDPELLTEETIETIEKSGDKPFMVNVFYSITHFPFSAPYPYYNKYADLKYAGPFKYYKQIVVQLGEGSNAKAEGAVELSDKDKKQVNDLYDGCLNSFDKQVGALMDYLKEKDLLKDTIVLLYSDHGENIYDYDFGMGHGEHLKGDVALEVPMVIRADHLKNLSGKTFVKTSSIIDVFPTLFDAAGIDKPEFFQGRSLLKEEKPHMGVNSYVETGIWFDNNKSAKLFFQHNRINYPDISGISEIDFSFRNEGVLKQSYQNIINGAKYRTIYSGNYKLIYMPTHRGIEYELYDHINDPSNRTNLILKKPVVFKEMKKLMTEFLLKKSGGNIKKVGDYYLPFFSDPVF